MKRNKLILGIACLSILTATSCKDQMEYDEYEVYGDDYMKSHWSRVSGIMDLMYNQLESDFGAYSGAMMASATDEAVYSHSGAAIEDFYNGAWSAVNDRKHLWTEAWKGIQYANLVLNSFNGLTFDDYKNQTGFIDSYKHYLNYQYEARFLRAYYYFSLLREYGGMPIITSELGADEANSQPRNTADEVFDFIESECNDIVDKLVMDYRNPGWATSSPETGRANARAAMALRSRAALYHASPLFVGSHDEKQMWGKAAKYAKIALDTCLNRNMKLISDYSKLFQPDSYKELDEVIMDRRGAGGNSNNFEKYNFPVSMLNAGGGNCPTQNLVDAYEMAATSLPITDPASGYDPANPYVGRDPRMYVTVATNGESWPQQLPKASLETYYGGADGQPNTNATTTGYYLKKFCVASQGIGTTGASTTYHNWLIFRLAELYLNYAEAMVNYTGDPYATSEFEGVQLDMTAAQAVNAVRNRAGLKDLPEGLTKEQFIERYKNEKFVEFAFENHRFYDIRRWKEGDKHLEIKSMNITMNADSSFTYNVVVDNTTRKWNDRNYFFPIPQADMMKQKGGWEQNPGW